MIELNDIEGFEWDEANVLKNWDKHQVLASECEELFFNIPVLLFADQRHSQSEPRYYVLGKTNRNRKLFVAFTVRDEKIRVISARPMSRKERVIYAKASA